MLRRLLSLLVLVLLTAQTAAAHEELVSAEPAPGSTVESSPTEVVLRFSAEVVPAADGVSVVGTDGERADDGEITRRDPSTVVVGLRPDLPPGRYAVEWRVLAGDGDVQEGGHEFTIGGDPTAATQAATSTTSTTAAAEDDGDDAPDLAADDEDDEDDDDGGGTALLLVVGLVLLVVLAAGLVLRRRRRAG